MEKYSKFLIVDDKLILMKVTYHKDICTDVNKIKGGGWYRYLNETDMIVFFGESTDFGKAKLDDIKRCVENGKIYYDIRSYEYHNISDRHNFGYDIGSEIIILKSK